MRSVISVSGKDAQKFLQDTVTNTVPAEPGQLAYNAILSPQGKYLFDFFLSANAGGYLLDIDATQADALMTRMAMYKLRADVAFEKTDLAVSRGLGDAPNGAMVDPRHSALGWRIYSPEAQPGDVDWDAIRVAHVIPETGIELIPNDTYILEAGFERLNGVDFKKGCYIGQEVTARMKHKTELRKGLAQITISGEVPVGTDITKDGRPVGKVFTQSGGKAIAYLRLDRAGEGMEAGNEKVTLA